MGLLEYIEKTREKSEAGRRRTAVFFTSLIMVIIVALWLTLSLAVNSDFKEKNNVASPFSVIKDIFK